MMKLLLLLFALLATPAHAADNELVVTPGSGLTIRSIDIGAGVQAPGHALVDATGGQLGISGAPLYIRAASGGFASGSIASGAIAAGAQVDLLTMRGTKNAGTAAANSLLAGGVYNSTPLTLTDTQQSSLQLDAAGNLLVSAAGYVQGSTTSGQTGSLIMGAVTTGAPTYTNADTEPLSLTTAGDLRTVFSNTTIAVTNGGTFAVQTSNTGAIDSAIPANVGVAGCAARSAEQTAVTNGDSSALNCDLAGRLVVQPYSVKELMVRGSGSATDTSATTVLAAGSGSNKTYVTDWMCSNTSATAARVTFNDSASTTVIVPAGGGNNKSLNVPLVTAAATAFTFTASTGVSTMYCSATGYYGL